MIHFSSSSPVASSNILEDNQRLEYVDVKTSVGEFTVELYPDYAPRTVKNFLDYAREHHYDNTVFHCVTTDMIQGGSRDRLYSKKIPKKPCIKNESCQELKNRVGTLAMSLIPGQPDSATAPFLINLKDNPTLDASSYCVFGKVWEDDMGLINKIALNKIAPGTRLLSGQRYIEIESIIQRF